MDVPRNEPDELIKLAEDVQKQSEALGDDCPLKAEPYMGAMKTDTAKAKELRAEAERLHQQAEAKNGQALKLLGLAPGQNLSQEGTVIFNLTSARDRLLQVHRTREKNLEPYGFPVKISETVPGARKKDKGNTPPA